MRTRAIPSWPTTVGTVTLRNPVMTASGTAGHGAELAPYVDLAGLGAVVTKSVAADPWPGNPAPRVHEATAGMLNAVGLQGPGIAEWLAHELPPLLDAGATVVMPLDDQFWGDRYGVVRDPFGHQWSLGQPVREVSYDEIQQAMSQA